MDLKQWEQELRTKTIEERFEIAKHTIRNANGYENIGAGNEHYLFPLLEEAIQVLREFEISENLWNQWREEAHFTEPMDREKQRHLTKIAETAANAYDAWKERRARFCNGEPKGGA